MPPDTIPPHSLPCPARTLPYATLLGSKTLFRIRCSEVNGFNDELPNQKLYQGSHTSLTFELDGTEGSVVSRALQTATQSEYQPATSRPYPCPYPYSYPYSYPTPTPTPIP
jgi:hypothetical protein